jgi:hypothetical protein
MNFQATKRRTTKADRLVMISMTVCFVVTSVILIAALATSSPVLQIPFAHTASTAK